MEDKLRILNEFAAWYKSLAGRYAINERQCRELWGFFNAYMGRNERPICNCSVCAVKVLNKLKTWCKENNIDTKWK